MEDAGKNLKNRKQNSSMKSSDSLDAPDAKLMQQRLISSWMLAPGKGDEDLREAFINEIHLRQLVRSISKASIIHSDADSNAGIVHVMPTTPYVEIVAPIKKKIEDLEDSPTNASSRILKLLARSVQISHKHPRLILDLETRFKNGFVAGVVLLASFFFTQKRENGEGTNRHQGSQGNASKVAMTIADISYPAVRNHFSQFNAVAPFWAAYLLCRPEVFVSCCGKERLNKYAKTKLDFDFLYFVEDHTHMNMLTSFFRKWGKVPDRKSRNVLLKKAPITFGGESIYTKVLIPTEIAVLLERHYKRGKLDK